MESVGTISTTSGEFWFWDSSESSTRMGRPEKGPVELEEDEEPDDELAGPVVDVGCGAATSCVDAMLPMRSSKSRQLAAGASRWVRDARRPVTDWRTLSRSGRPGRCARSGPRARPSTPLDSRLNLVARA